MTAKILNGKEIAAQIRADLKAKIEALKVQNKRAPGLGVVLVGENPASQVYVRGKRKACQEVGIVSFDYNLSANTSQDALLKLVQELNQNPEVDGILVQLPLPEHINSHLIVDSINPKKDIDGFHPYNLGLLAQKRPQLRSCTPYGIMALLQYTNETLVGKHAVVVGASNIVGRPMALELLLARCTVTICHSKTHDLEKHVSQADILVIAIGKPGIVKSEWIKAGAIVIDVGINRQDDGTLKGDIDFETAKQKASWITPVPGGVGPMTVATLLQNTYLAYTQSS